MSFGTGAVKMTPAHDPNDYEVGMRHQLEFINILNDDGTLNSNAGPEFEGMKRFHARVKVVDEMKKKGLYVGDAENPMSIPVCAKSGDFIESVMKPQWWVSCKSLAEKAIEVRRLPPRPCLENERELTTFPTRLSSSPRPPLPPSPSSSSSPFSPSHTLAAHPCRRAQDPPGDVRGRLVPVARGHPGLVHLPPAVVGPPRAGLLCQDRGRGAGCASPSSHAPLARARRA